MYLLSVVVDEEVIENAVRNNFKLCRCARESDRVLNVLYAADVELQNCFKAVLASSYRSIVMLVFAHINSYACLALVDADIDAVIHIKITLTERNKCR